MGLRRLSVGGVDIVIFFPDALARKIRTIGGILPDSTDSERTGAPPLSNQFAEARGIQERVNQIEWYHTIELVDGIVTPGWFDLRPLLPHYPVPERLDGKRVLDVATFDGFWAFEFERRGAAEVVALDIDSFAEVDMAPRIRRQKDPAYLARKTGRGFKLCHEVLESKVRREVLNVYDLSPERLGKFDFVFVSDLLLHLRNPMKALDNICRVTAGHAAIVDVFNPGLPGRLMSYRSGMIHNTWWTMSLGALEQMIRDAGFGRVELCDQFQTGYRGEKPMLWHSAFRAWT